MNSFDVLFLGDILKFHHWKMTVEYKSSLFMDQYFFPLTSCFFPRAMLLLQNLDLPFEVINN